MGDWPSIIMPGSAKCIGNARATNQTGGSGNTKTAWSEVIASTPFTGFAMITLHPAGTLDFLYDIGIGAAGSEVVLIADLLYSCPTSVNYEIGQPILIPILIPAGSRLSYRAQSYSTSLYTNCAISIVMIDQFMANSGFALVDTYGAVVSDSGGTGIDPGTSAGVKGSFTQITAATLHTCKGIMLKFGNQRNTAMSNAYWYVDVGLTASPTDNIIISDFYLASRSESDNISPNVTPIIPVNIPTGTEIHVRASCSITDATDRKFDVVLYCFG